MTKIDHDQEKKKESERILSRVESDGQTFLTRTRRGGTPDELDDSPKMLFWGKLIGRSLAIIFVFYLLWSLYSTLTGR